MGLFEQRWTREPSPTANHWRATCTHYQRIGQTSCPFSQFHRHHSVQNSKVNFFAKFFTRMHRIETNKRLKIICSRVRDLMHQFLFVTDSLVKAVHLDKAKSLAVAETLTAVARLSALYESARVYTSSALVCLLALKCMKFDMAMRFHH